MRGRSNKFLSLMGADVEETSSALSTIAGLIAQNEPELLVKPESNSFYYIYDFIMEHHLDGLYPVLGTIYSILATIPSSSAECERVFSKLRRIKDRLSNGITNVNLSNRLHLGHESGLMWDLDRNEIIQRFAETSSELKALLFP
jgi:hypothetical protein